MAIMRTHGQTNLGRLLVSRVLVVSYIAVHGTSILFPIPPRAQAVSPAVQKSSKRTILHDFSLALSTSLMSLKLSGP